MDDKHSSARGVLGNVPCCPPEDPHAIDCPKSPEMQRARLAEWEPCPDCNGNGVKTGNGHHFRDCEACKGRGTRGVAGQPDQVIPPHTPMDPQG